MQLTLAAVALIGIVPVVLQYRDRSQWFAVGYGTLVVAAFATNLEDVLLGDLMNLVEHGVGLMGAGLAFFAAAYVHRQRVVGADDGAGGATDADEVSSADAMVSAAEAGSDG